jgi:NAD(P)-dependent dehydrogenase (short-subunit alcohol dehydrogenase family)
LTGIFAKAAGLEGAKADKVAGAAKELFATFQPTPRAGATEDIARAAVFLASDGSSFVNGHNLVVDGALTAVGRGWSESIAGRAEIAKRVKAAAAAL